MTTVAVGIAGVLLSLVLFVVVSVVHKLITDEIVGYVPVLTASLIRRRTKTLPEAVRERWEAEWIAEAACFHDRKLRGLWFAAVDLRRAARDIAPPPTSAVAARIVLSVERKRLSEAAIAEIIARVVERTAIHRDPWSENRRDLADVVLQIRDLGSTISEFQVQRPRASGDTRIAVQDHTTPGDGFGGPGRQR